MKEVMKNTSTGSENSEKNNSNGNNGKGPIEKDYKDTLNLPKTEFPMRGALPEREPKQIERWLNDRVYFRLLEKNRKKGKGKFLLHDGPPYANGGIHMGTALNKILKDVVVKYKSMSGYESPYVPGWDCHGLPIELGVEKQILEQKKDKQSMPLVEIRQMCREYANRFITMQREQFQRLEVFGDWENPYLTMSPDYVASIVRELGRCAKEGVLYKGNKAVYWCASCATALAEAEIEYAEKTSPSIYVKFDLPKETLAKLPELASIAKREAAVRTSVIIWTTTPWTLPANMGIAFHPTAEYVVVKAPALEGTELWIMAKDLQESVEKAAGFAKASVPLMTFTADKLHKLHASHPFIEGRQSLLLLGDHVTLDAGTGAVHTAPGHGQDDYWLGIQYGLEIFSPVDAKGKFTGEFPLMQGQFIFKCNEPIIQMLAESGHLLSKQDIKHSYPHCWRCRKPVFFRATPQWFIEMEPRNADSSKRSLRKESEAAIHQCTWIPASGINRILGMIQSRPDWCVSRQRAWGVPITVFYCENCSELKADPKIFDYIAGLIEKRGPDIWFTDSPAELMPPGTQCSKCHQSKFVKETDILDVWFDSGISHAAVCERRGLGWPADLYLEGSDQHRGWFQTSLLTGVATRHKAPFKTVLTHGFVNDKEGKKMSKSKGNTVSPLDLIKSHGAEILRLWVVLEDYRNDVDFSMESIERISESYRKIRNTIRFLLGNLFDFNADKHTVAVEKMSDLDRWALSRSADYFEKILKSYESYEFHHVYQALMNYCNVDLSSIYFDILKDRLYTAGTNSHERRSSQSAMMHISVSLIKLLAPILSFTAEEAWSHLPSFEGKQSSVFLENFPDFDKDFKVWQDSELVERFSKVWQVRESTFKALEDARQEKKIGHPREAKVDLTVSPIVMKTLQEVSEDLSRILLVSELNLAAASDGTPDGQMGAQIFKSAGIKCARCWVYRSTVGQSKEDPNICHKCVEALNAG